MLLIYRNLKYPNLTETLQSSNRFLSSFLAAVGKSTNLTGEEKFNYIRCFLEGDALHAIVTKKQWSYYKTDMETFIR